jgi:RNA polymerase sigma-70 factor, ECF subfamily
MEGGKTRNPIENSEQDRSWVFASQKGDTAAFNRLVLKWEKTVFNIALRMLRNQDEAEEATQEVFLLAYRYIRRFRSDSKFSTWLYRIAMNHCLTCVKNRPPGVHFSLDDKDTAQPAVEHLQVPGAQDRALLLSEQQEKLSAELLRLHPEQQAIIELKFFQEMKFEEIAEILSEPLSTVKSRMYSGLEMLKTRLGNGFMNGREE